MTESLGTEVYCVRFSPDESFLASGCGNGCVSIYNVSTSQEAFRLSHEDKCAAKQVCWRPEAHNSSLRSRVVIVSASTDGCLRQWHVTSRKCIWDLQLEGETQLLCVDYRFDGAQIAAGGLRDIWVFDEETKKQIQCLNGGNHMSTMGHSSRIFAIRFHPSEPSTIVSGGWDRTVQIWDQRAGHAVREIFGPYICGDALDISGDGRWILTGSWRDTDQLEMWDFGSGKRFETVAWRPSDIEASPCMLYSARFLGFSGRFVGAGGSVIGGGGEAKVFDRSSKERRCLGTIIGSACLSWHFAERTGHIAFGCADGRIRMLSSDGVPIEAAPIEPTEAEVASAEPVPTCEVEKSTEEYIISLDGMNVEALD